MFSTFRGYNGYAKQHLQHWSRRFKKKKDWVTLWTTRHRSTGNDHGGWICRKLFMVECTAQVNFHLDWSTFSIHHFQNHNILPLLAHPFQNVQIGGYLVLVIYYRHPVFRYHVGSSVAFATNFRIKLFTIDQSFHRGGGVIWLYLVVRDIYPCLSGHLVPHHHPPCRQFINKYQSR